ncbi:cold shock domain-containing protein [Dactylosporangium sp. CA-152071]|uniref:cold shock domain-containing protein n=1 Tax=Dactylosporangium sp. CA-152071 TaxID=3239933 RepID=UPI003D926550
MRVVVVSMSGTLVRYDDVRGYGFIAVAGGGEDVFVHASDFGDARHLARAGKHVEFEAETTDRGPKVVSVRLVDEARPPVSALSGEEGECDVLTPRAFEVEVTELLLQHVGSLSGDQIRQVREFMGRLARTHGWIEA